MLNILILHILMSFLILSTYPNPKSFSSVIYHFIFYLCIWTLMPMDQTLPFINKMKQFFHLLCLIKKINLYIIKIRGKSQRCQNIQRVLHIYQECLYCIWAWSTLQWTHVRIKDFKIKKNKRLKKKRKWKPQINK